ncbi:MAG: tetratricopeptide repeat protein [Bacteroidales bacterium]|nr:tetratricopeptide repeat protein [Bacteroidales bacterium]MDD3702439.1 tetratricopeptide repeat protein [Bacteroidales bacterium]MDY0370497.1 tetratricopeptide repeat protein [Bacteroidales bacterium]
MKRTCDTIWLICINITLLSLTVTAEDRQTDSLQQLLRVSKSDSTRIDALIMLSRTYLYTDLHLSLDYAEQALELAERQQGSEIYASALSNAGVVYFTLGMFEAASRSFYQYLAIQREKDNKQKIAFGLANIGAIHMQMNQFENAEPIYLSALQLLDELTTTDNKGETLPEIVTFYNNLGIINRELGKVDTAISYYQKGIHLAKSLSAEDEYLAMLYNNLGNIYIDTQQYDLAFQALQTALDLRIKNNNVSGMASSYRNIGSYYLSRKEYKQAEKSLYKAAELALIVGSKSLSQSIYSFLFQYYNELQKADSALKYHILMKELEDELMAEETMRELTSLELNAQFTEKEKLRQIEQKKKEQGYMFIAVILIMIIALVVLLFVLTKNRLKRLRLEKEVSDFATKNLSLEKDALEKELEVKRKEMTTQVMYQIKKNELVDTIAQKLLKHSPNFRKEDQGIIREILRDLEKAQKDDVWDEFELLFQGVHNEFYEKLQTICPDLTTNERRLCAFLKMHMSTKEIASITGQSLRSIEVARTRLRRKLKLTNSDTGLSEFLSSI